MNITGNVGVTGNISATGDVSITGDVSVTGNETVSGTLACGPSGVIRSNRTDGSGASTGNPNFSVSNVMNVRCNVGMTSSVQNYTTDSLNINGYKTSTSKLDIGDTKKMNVEISNGDLTVENGALTIEDVEITGGSQKLVVTVLGDQSSTTALDCQHDDGNWSKVRIGSDNADITLNCHQLYLTGGFASAAIFRITINRNAIATNQTVQYLRITKTSNTPTYSYKLLNSSKQEALLTSDIQSVEGCPSFLPSNVNSWVDYYIGTPVNVTLWNANQTALVMAWYIY